MIYTNIVPCGMAATTAELRRVAERLRQVAAERHLTPDDVAKLSESARESLHYEACKRAGVPPHGYCLAI